MPIWTAETELLNSTRCVSRGGVDVAAFEVDVEGEKGWERKSGSES